MSLLLWGAGNENTSGELSRASYSRGESLLAFEPGLIYPRTVSDMSAGAGSKMRKGKRDKVMGQRGWGLGGWWWWWGGFGKIPEESSNMPPSSESATLASGRL